MAFHPLKSLVLYYDSWYQFATTLFFQGNTIPITLVTQAPVGAPPNNAGIQVTVDPVTHVITLYVWDGSAWQTK